jgi:AcrR family transcriptional regulator
MVRPSKKQQIPNLQEAIKDTAWKQIAQTGAPALSLRAIARELEITAPAIYNYFADRDALVTALIIDAYTSFGNAQIAARDEIAETELVERLRVIGIAYRQWAIDYPQRYQLIFGTTIPGYEAPFMEILPFGARSLSALVGVIDALRMANKLQADDFPSVLPGYEEQFEVWRKYAGDHHILSLSVSMLVWSRVHGLVSLEIAGSLPPFGANGVELYQYEIASIFRQFIKP